MAVKLPVQDTIYFISPLLVLNYCFFLLVARLEYGVGDSGDTFIAHKRKKKKNTRVPRKHSHTSNSKRLITWMRLREEGRRMEEK